MRRGASPPPPLHAVAIVLACAGAVACGGESGTEIDVTVRDSAGIRVVSNGPVPRDRWVWTVTPTPILQIGTLQGAPEYQFFRVADAHRFEDGRIVVANAGTHELRRLERRSWEAMPRRETYPAYRSFTGDAVGNLWVRDFLPPDDERGIWTVLDSEGRAVGKVETPLGLRIFEIGDDYILGVMRDELDVEWLQLYALNKPGPPETRSSEPQPPPGTVSLR